MTGRLRTSSRTDTVRKVLWVRTVRWVREVLKVRWDLGLWGFSRFAGFLTIREAVNLRTARTSNPENLSISS